MHHSSWFGMPPFSSFFFGIKKKSYQTSSLFFLLSVSPCFSLFLPFALPPLHFLLLFFFSLFFFSLFFLVVFAFIIEGVGGRGRGVVAFHHFIKIAAC